MLPYQVKRRQFRQARESDEMLLAREIKKQHPEWGWSQCLIEARKDLCRRF